MNKIGLLVTFIVVLLIHLLLLFSYGQKKAEQKIEDLNSTPIKVIVKDLSNTKDLKPKEKKEDLKPKKEIPKEKEEESLEQDYTKKLYASEQIKGTDTLMQIGGTPKSSEKSKDTKEEQESKTKKVSPPKEKPTKAENTPKERDKKLKSNNAKKEDSKNVENKIIEKEKEPSPKETKQENDVEKDTKKEDSSFFTAKNFKGDDSMFNNPEGMSFEKSKYLEELNKILKKNVKYPIEALRNRMEGIVFIGFTVWQDGTISNIYIIYGSRYQPLNQAALEIFNSIDKFPPIPKEYNIKYWRLQTPIVFKITT